MKDYRKDEILAEGFLRSYKLNPMRFEKTHRQKDTPDFKVSTPSGGLFMCEVKSIDIDAIDKGIRHNTIYNSLTSKLHKAHKQFNSVNSNHFVPNVIVWVSHDLRINWHTFTNLMQGNIQVEGKLIRNLGKFSNGRIKHEKLEIDMHIWLHKNGEAEFLVNPRNLDFANKMIILFNLDLQLSQL